MIVGYYLEDGLLRFKNAELSETYMLKYHVDQSHVLAYVINDIGLVANSASFDYASDKVLLPAEAFMMNTPLYNVKNISKQMFRQGDEIEVQMYDKFFNPYGSGGGNISEPIDPDQALLGTYSVLSAVLGLRIESGDLSATGSSQWVRTYLPPDIYLKQYKMNPDGSFFFFKDLDQDDPEIVALGYNRDLPVQNMIWALRYTADDSPVMFEDGVTPKCFKFLNPILTSAQGGDSFDTDQFDLRSVNDTFYFEIVDLYIRLYNAVGDENNQLAFQIVDEPIIE